MAYNSVVAALEGVHFPISKRELISQIGNREVAVVENRMLSMSELLNSCESNNFNSSGDIIRCPGLVRKIESIPGAAAA